MDTFEPGAYAVEVYWSEEDGCFLAKMSDLPSCVADGPTEGDGSVPRTCRQGFGRPSGRANPKNPRLDINKAGVHHSAFGSRGGGGQTVGSGGGVGRR